MKEQFEDFMKVLKAFSVENIDYILIGGVAIVFHGYERLTRDLDIFLKMIPQNLDRFKKALFSVFNDPAIEEITIDELNKYPVIRYGTPSGFNIDIIGKLGTFNFDDLKYEILKFKGIDIRIATPETLYKLKEKTHRDKDKTDLLFLAELIRIKKET